MLRFFFNLSPAGAWLMQKCSWLEIGIADPSPRSHSPPFPTRALRASYASPATMLAIWEVGPGRIGRQPARSAS
jgi:hypothetical protein